MLAQAATACQTRGGRCREPTTGTPHYAPFPTNKAAGVHRAARWQCRHVAVDCAWAAATEFVRVGMTGVQPRTSAIYVAFVERMAELGYEEGKNFSFDHVQAANVAGYEAGYRELRVARWTFCLPPARRSA